MATTSLATVSENFSLLSLSSSSLVPSAHLSSSTLVDYDEVIDLAFYANRLTIQSNITLEDEEGAMFWTEDEDDDLVDFEEEDEFMEFRDDEDELDEDLEQFAMELDEEIKRSYEEELEEAYKQDGLKGI
ncbi:hypothetical protein BGZ54_002860 [Gamsiella multidivaricata]|nr:hypothetical protein BGZ54_002860 [Gamsiella multidivaricata]